MTEIFTRYGGILVIVAHSNQAVHLRQASQPSGCLENARAARYDENLRGNPSFEVSFIQRLPVACQISQDSLPLEKTPEKNLLFFPGSAAATVAGLIVSAAAIDCTSIW